MATDLTPLGAVGLAGAGVVAGVIGTGGGITSLVSYPALLVAGAAPLVANITNLVSLVVCWPGSAAASRRELAGTRRWLARWCPVAALAGAAGAGLLLLTPPGAFVDIVPVLVLVASAGMVAQPWISRRRPAREGGRSLRLGLPAVALYNGYFGAGAGIMTLGLVLHGAEPDLPRANARKNMLVGAATMTSAVVVAASGRVDWAAAGPLAAGLFVGSLLGPLAARRLRPGAVRAFVALCGVALAAYLWAS